MFRIGEFSKLTHVSIRMLRYYDENGLLLPEHVDEITGYRMYSTAQISQLQTILFLKDIGLGIVQMKQVMEHWEENDWLKQCLLLQKSVIEDNIQREKESLLRIESAISDLEHQSLEMNLQVTMKHLPAYSVISLRKVVENYFQEGELWGEFMKELKATKRLNLASNPSLSIYHDQEAEQGVDMELCIILPESDSNPDAIKIKDSNLQYIRTREIQNAACFFVYGPFEKIDEAYQRFAVWLEQHPQYQMTGECRQIVHKGPQECANPKDYVIELQVEVKIMTNKK